MARGSYAPRRHATPGPRRCRRARARPHSAFGTMGAAQPSVPEAGDSDSAADGRWAGIAAAQMHGYQPSGRHCCFSRMQERHPSVRAPPGACSSFRAGVLGVVVEARVCSIGGRYGGERRREAFALSSAEPGLACLEGGLRAIHDFELGTPYAPGRTRAHVPEWIMRLGTARAACRVRAAARRRAGPCGRWPR
jgi:hypothetical protein